MALHLDPLRGSVSNPLISPNGANYGGGVRRVLRSKINGHRNARTREDFFRFFRHWARPRAEEGAEVAGTVTCFECGEPGHIASQCPNVGQGDGGPVDADAPWCGGCDQRTRQVTVSTDPPRVKRCPRCWLARMAARGHPDARYGLALPQSRELDPHTKLKARWIRETENDRPPSPELQAEMQVWATSAEEGAAGARALLAAMAEAITADEADAARDPGRLHGPERARAQLAEAAAAGLRAPTLPPPAPGEEATPPATSSANGHRAGEDPPSDEFPF